MNDVDVSKIGMFDKWRERYHVEEITLAEKMGLLHALLPDIGELIAGRSSPEVCAKEYAKRLIFLIRKAIYGNGESDKVHKLARGILAYQFFEKQNSIDIYSGPGPLEFNRVISKLIIEQPELCATMISFFSIDGDYCFINIPPGKSPSDKNTATALAKGCEKLCYLLTCQKEIGYGSSSYGNLECKLIEQLSLHRQAFMPKILDSLFSTNPKALLTACWNAHYKDNFGKFPVIETLHRVVFSYGLVLKPAGEWIYDYYHNVRRSNDMCRLAHADVYILLLARAGLLDSEFNSPPTK
ncbi:MAG: hypothetical protein AAB484_02855 [Patescibacteria group bacterium]